MSRRPSVRSDSVLLFLSGHGTVAADYNGISVKGTIKMNKKTLGLFGRSWGRNARSNFVPRVLSYWERGWIRVETEQGNGNKQTRERFPIFRYALPDCLVALSRQSKTVLDSGFKKGPGFRKQGYLTLSELGIGYRTSGVWKRKGKERNEKL